MADEVIINTPVQGADKPWFEGLDTETKGYITARGLDKKPVTEALALTIQAHRNAESKLGIPADRVFKWPDENDAEGLKALYTKLGVPQDATGYDFSTVKSADGKPLDEGFAAFLRAAASELHLPKVAAEALAAKFVKHTDDAVAADKGAADAQKQVALDTLRGNWGAQYDTNKYIADRAASLMGISAEALNAMSQATTFPAVMEGLRKMGVAMGEAKLIGGGETGIGNRVLTRDEAASKKAELLQDRDFGKRWFQGDKKALDEITNLDRIIVGMPQRAM